MPVEITELCNLGKWSVSSQSMKGDKISTFTAVIGHSNPSIASAIGITKPKGFEFQLWLFINGKGLFANGKWYDSPCFLRSNDQIEVVLN